MPFLRSKLEGLERVHHHETRFRSDFRVPVPTTKKVELNLIYQSVSAWNEVPMIIRQRETLLSFKNSLMSHLIENLTI